MMETRELICINCPLGCSLTVTMENGTVKKVELLKKYGTIEKIAEAPAEEIATLKGINLELANEIKKQLNNKQACACG